MYVQEEAEKCIREAGSAIVRIETIKYKPKAAKCGLRSPEEVVQEGFENEISSLSRERAQGARLLRRPTSFSLPFMHLPQT